MDNLETICLDFHGTVFDHRISKMNYFQEVLNIDYSSPFLERKDIVKEINEKYGYDEDFYIKNLEKFMKSDYSLSGEFVHGFQDFIKYSPNNWNYIILSATNSGITNIKRTIQFSNLDKISGVYCVKKEKKAIVANYLNASIYFDDRSDLFDDFLRFKIKTIQINYPKTVKPKSEIYFNNWFEAKENIDIIKSFLNR